MSGSLGRSSADPGHMNRLDDRDGYLGNHNSSSWGSRMNCANSSTPIRKSSYNYPSSPSPITVTTLPDGRVERRLETCSYQETEMWFRRAFSHECPSVVGSFVFSMLSNHRSGLELRAHCASHRVFRKPQTRLDFSSTRKKKNCSRFTKNIHNNYNYICDRTNKKYPPQSEYYW